MMFFDIRNLCFFFNVYVENNEYIWVVTSNLEGTRADTEH